MTPDLTSKLPHVGTTIFTVMSQLAADCKAINLSQGFPDFAVSPELVDLVAKHMLAGHNQYAPMAGVLPLREAISAKLEELYDTKVDPETEITVTSGATEALFTAVTVVVRPGDEVIVFDPAYDAYAPAIELSGGMVVHIPMRAPHYAIDWDEVAARTNKRTRLIIINTPHNPTGTVLSDEDLQALARLVETTGILILADEVYEHMVFDGRRHQSMLRHPVLASHSFVVSSFGKTYHITGWKIGYCIAPARLSAEFRKVHQYVTFSTATPMQFALAEFLQHKRHYLDLPAFYQAKRDKFCGLLKTSRFKFTPAQGTYFQLLDYSDITDLRDTDYARQLTRDVGVAAIPISIFNAQRDDHKVLRFCFAKDEITLERAAEILCGI